MLWIEDGASIKVDNVTFENSSSYGIYMEDGARLKSFTGNKFKSLDMNPILLSANEVGLLDKIESSDNEIDTIFINGGIVTKSATWKNISTFYMIGKSIDINAPVTVNGGITILIGPENKISVSDSGSLKLMGTTDAQINIRSSKPSPSAGDWKGINIYKTASKDNEWSYVNILHGGSTGYGQLWVEKGAFITLNHCHFMEGKDCDVYLEDGANVTNYASTYNTCEH